MDASEFVRRHHNKEKYDRFIPNRAAMNFDYAHYMIFEGWKKPNKTRNEAYMKRLREAFDFDKTRILEFKSEPPARIKFGVGPPHYCASASLHQTRPVKPPRHVPKEPEHELDVSDLLDDYCLNLLDWSSRNVVAIALGTTVHLWDASLGLASELVTVDDDAGPVTSVSWAPNGCHIALGLNNSEVQLWDSIANRQVGTLRGCHRARVGSLAWNNQILTTGSMDGQIINHDMRVADHKVVIYKGHKEEVCGLKWSPSGQQLASAGNDKLLHIWDRSMATKWLHRLKDHTDAVKALAWSPFESHLLASGGVGNDHCIKFWKTHTGKCLNSIDTGSPVISLLWSRNGPELLSSDGSTNSQMTLWKYPSMVKTAELMGGHTPNVLYMAQSPDGCTVASAGDEILQFWDVFEPRKEKANEPFAHLSRIR